MNPNPLKSIFRACVIAAFVGGVPAHGQVIIEDETYQRESTEDFFGKLSLSSSSGSSHETGYQSLEVGYDTAFSQERGRVYFSGIASNTNLELDLELDDSVQRDTNDGLEETRKVDEDESDFDVRDAFVQYNLPGDLVFTLGRRRVAWGQFDLFSPVNLALPLTPQTAEPIAKKINTMVPQDQVAFSWFPSERMEVQAYYFFSTEVDYLIEEVIAGDDTDSAYNGTDTMRRDVRIADQNDITDHSHYAARVLLYRDWGTLGFTYHKGRDTLAFDSDRAMVAQVTTNLTFAAFNVRRNTDLPETENVGVELAVPAGQWVWKLEVLHQETSTDLKGASHQYDGTMLDATDNLRDYLQSVIDNNNHELYVPVDRTIIGIGADSDRDNWRFNLGLFIVEESYDSETEALIELEEDAGFDQNRGETAALPALNIARYIGGDKEKELGFVAGVLGTYAGVSLYYTSHIGENFRWVIAAEAARNLRDQLVSDTGPDSDRYELADDVSSGGRISLTYSF